MAHSDEAETFNLIERSRTFKIRLINYIECKSNLKKTLENLISSITLMVFY